MIAYQDIIQATKDFDIRYYIGTGGYGSVYRAQLPSNKVVPLKKFHGWECEDPAYLKSFENEVQSSQASSLALYRFDSITPLIIG